MFGTNPHRPIIISGGEHLQVQGIFHTIQGEGPLSGMPATFIRLAGCNLACVWCDTDFESSYEKGNEMSVAGILDAVSKVTPPTTRFIVLTGGEPLRQNVGPLIRALIKQGHRVQIETAGVIGPQEELLPFIERGHLLYVVSPKTPRVHGWFRQHVLHWKYIIAADDYLVEDGLPWRSTQKKVDGAEVVAIARPPFSGPLHPVTVWVSPRDDQDEARNEANRQAAVSSCLQFGYRLSLQTHKIVGVE